MLRGRDLRTPLATLIFFTLAAGDFWRNLLSWWGWGALCAVLLVAAFVSLVRARPSLRWVPAPLWLFFVVIVASVFWSNYPLASVLGVLATMFTTVGALFLALVLDRAQIVRALGLAMRWVLGLSLAFEFIVDAFVGHPVLPFFVEYGSEVPAAFYWSRALLFEGGRIQGITGNANLLATAALIALIAFAILYAAGMVRRVPTIGWSAVAALTIALTRSSTIVVAAAVVVAVLAVILFVRPLQGRLRTIAQLATTVAGAIGLTLALLFQTPMLMILSRTTDLTNRGQIWDMVVTLAGERPVFGWGWVSYWVPWAEPFRGLAEFNGVTYLQAHNAWLDVWLQVGFVGAVVFGLFVVGAILRAWWLATQRQLPVRLDNGAMAVFPILILTALLLQSLTESRLLVEFGWTLLVVCAIWAKQRTMLTVL